MENSIISGSGINYSHRFLFLFAEKQLNAANDRECKFQPFTLAAVIFSFMAFEAYLNFVGSQLFPEKWKNERKEFGRGSYPGPIGKLNWLSEQVNFSIKDDLFLYEAISKLKNFRDNVVHAMPVPYQISDSGNIQDDPEFPLQPSFLEDISQNEAKEFLENVRSVSEALHQALISYHGPDKILLYAFKGSLGKANWS